MKMADFCANQISSRPPARPQKFTERLLENDSRRVRQSEVLPLLDFPVSGIDDIACSQLHAFLPASEARVLAMLAPAFEWH